MRAGIVRPSSLETFVVGTLDACGGVTVHAVPVIAHGFEGDARALRLLQAAIEGLAKPTSRHWPPRTGFYLSLAHPDRQYSGFELIPDEELRSQKLARWRQVRADRAEPDFNQRAKSLLERAATLAGWKQAVHLRAFAMSGNTGVAEMTEAAARDLNAGAVDVAIVGGVDSWIDATSLQWLEDRGRLKGPATPAGLAPGEAAGFLVLEAMPYAQTRDARIQAVLQSTIVDREQKAQLAGKLSLGETLALVLARTAPIADWSAEAPPWLIVDQNGESYRAREWGSALARLVEGHPSFQAPVVWYPVTSVGDTGCATGVVQAVMALQAFERGYAKGRQVTLLASADAGERSATLLEARGN
jgi:3-oxoacyl-[acyl-carrier-protein] synthase-1